MLTKKENTKYGYKARIRYDTKNPTIHVMKKEQAIMIEGEADLTIITGKANVERIKENKKVTDTITDKETVRIQEEEKVTIRNKQDTVLIEENYTKNNIEEYLQLTVQEDEPSADDLKYIEE